MRKKNKICKKNEQTIALYFFCIKRKENQLENTGNERERKKEKDEKQKPNIHSLDAVARDDLSLD